jgi:TatA/E family protein of Tat protein translocase
MLSYTLAIAMPGMFEWIIIGGLGLLIFGRRLPSVGKGLGEGIRNFRLGLKEGEAAAEAADHKAITEK